MEEQSTLEMVRSKSLKFTCWAGMKRSGEENHTVAFLLGAVFASPVLLIQVLWPRQIFPLTDMMFMLLLAEIIFSCAVAPRHVGTTYSFHEFFLCTATTGIVMTGLFVAFQQPSFDIALLVAVCYPLLPAVYLLLFYGNIRVWKKVWDDDDL
jgi:hypothetical protein